MKALIVRPGHLSVEEVPDPAVGPYDALCRMLYGSVCAGTDTRVIDGTFGEREATYPSIIGHESIGEVIAVGSQVRSFGLGDHVTRVSAQPSTVGLALSWGGMCEFGIARDHAAMQRAGLPAEQWQPYRVNEVIPRGVIEDVYEPLVITWRETHGYVHRLGIRSGDRVLVSGSGANGISIAAMAKLAGASVTVVGSKIRIDQVQRVGAVGVNYRDSAALEHLVREEASTFSAIIDATGKSNSINHLLPLLAPEGTLGVYGMDDLDAYRIEPLNGPSRYSIYNGGYFEPESHDPVMELIRQKRLDPAVWIDRNQVFGWDTAASAYEVARARTLIKPVLRLSADEIDQKEQPK